MPLEIIIFYQFNREHFLRETSIYVEFYHSLGYHSLQSMENLVTGITKHNPKNTIHHLSFMGYCKEENKISEWRVLHTGVWKVTEHFSPSLYSSHHHLLSQPRFPCHWKRRELTSQTLIQAKENNSFFIFQIFCWTLVPFRSPTPFLTSTASWMTNRIQNRMYKSSLRKGHEEAKFY